MKLRTGFVSNSSSSSFTCCVCGDTQSGMDMGLSEACMNECQAGHVFCDDHKLGEHHPTIDQMRSEMLLSAYEEDKEEIKNAGDDEIQEMWDDFDFEEGGSSRYSCMAEFCPVCQLKTLTDTDALEYLMKIHNTNLKTICKEIKEKYGSYAEFRKAMKGTK